MADVPACPTIRNLPVKDDQRISIAQRTGDCPLSILTGDTTKDWEFLTVLQAPTRRPSLVWPDDLSAHRRTVGRACSVTSPRGLGL
jgi:DTW domain-containing protein YfiP